MYCPNCGQQQVSDEMRFCSRCGLALSGLSEWLAHGRAPLIKRDETQPEPMSPRRKNMRRAAKMMFFSAALFPLFVIMAVAEDNPGPIAVPFLVFFISLAWMLYARLFSDKQAPATLPSTQTQATVFGPAPTRQALPPPINVPTPNIGRHQVRTNELAQPPSVTENTTRLLDDE